MPPPVNAVDAPLSAISAQKKEFYMTMKAHFEYLVTSTIEEINKAIKNAASLDNNYGAKGEFCDIIKAYALSYFSTNPAKADIAFTGIKTNYPERFDYIVSLKDDMYKIQTQIDEINSLPRQDKTAKTKSKTNSPTLNLIFFALNISAKKVTIVYLIYLLIF